MPIWLFPFFGFLGQVMGSLVGRVLLALSISFVTFTGMAVGVDWMLEEVRSNYQNLPSDVLNFLSYMWVDKAITMVFSAFTAALALKTAGAGTIKKMVTK